MLQLVDVGHKSLADYASTRLARGDGRDPPTGRAAAGKAGRPSLGDGVRRRRGRDQLRPRPADEGRRPGRGVADHPRRGRVLRGHEDDPQRAPGRPAGPDARSSRRFSTATTRSTRSSSRTTTTTSSSTTRSRRRWSTTSRTRPAHWIWRCHIDLSTPNPDVLAFLAPSLERYDAAIFHMQRVRAAERRAPPGDHLAARDRSADAQEHGALDRGRGVRRRPVRDPSRAAAARPRSHGSTRGRTRSA